MKPETRFRFAAYLSLLFLFIVSPLLRAAEMIPAPPRIVVGKTTNGQPRLVFPYPAAQSYEILSADTVLGPFTPDTTSGRFLGPTFIVTNGNAMKIFKVGAVPMSSNELFMATVLNRLTYGPTPDDIDRIRAIGADAYIAEQMSGELIPETIDTAPRIVNTPLTVPPPPPLTNWIRRSATGTANGSNFGIYLSAAGTVYIDNVTLVTGTNADVGTNMITNGDFEIEPVTNGWLVGISISGANTVITNSPTVDGLAASGDKCLRLVATAGNTTLGNGLWQPFTTNLTVSLTQRYTLSFSYLPVQNAGTNILTVRMSGSATVGTAALPSSPLAPPAPPTPPPAISHVYERLTNTTARLDDLRAWHVFRAIHSKRQLNEVLAQFFQNHFTTQFSKTDEYFDNNFQYGQYTNDIVRENLALDLHWREHSRLRQALLNPNCNFHDLLKISIESEAMIIYLDTILSGRAAPNQNYAREIMELGTMGADNGYIQQDIVELAKVWTGWRVDKKDASVANNPFAAPIPRTDLTNFANTPGLWVLHYNSNQHHVTGHKYLFTNNVIHPRFGAAFGGGTSYSLILSNTQATGTNGMAEGYKVAQHLANLPYTMEYLSVKFCRVFVHEDFHYGEYDYRIANLSPEAQLIKDCMTAWNTPAGDGRKGNIRSVLTTIFNSALFRSHGASQQKVKTPLEFAVSAVRALRTVSTDTNSWVSSTCDSDGYGITGTNSNTSPLNRMGGMGLFNKPEPDGWSEFGRIWMNTANLCERMRFAQHLLMANSSSLKTSDYSTGGTRNTSDPVALLRAKLPGASWNNAAAVTDFFLGLLYPGEGAANLGRDREAAINYLNTDEAGTGNSAFSGLSGAAYDGRVRSMVGFLMCLPRFQEQ